MVPQAGVEPAAFPLGVSRPPVASCLLLSHKAFNNKGLKEIVVLCCLTKTGLISSICWGWCWG